jgi:hypothetical protein
MKLAETLKQDAEGVYLAAEGLFKQVDGNKLDWKPATGTNWMNVGQLLLHCTEACGKCIKGFVTGEWDFPAPPPDAPPPDPSQMPKAETMRAVTSVDEALKMLAADKALCMKILSEVSDERLANERSAPPWGGPERSLYQHCNEMIWHLGQHKGQLFYYLKLQGKDVNTMTLWAGM